MDSSMHLFYGTSVIFFNTTQTTHSPNQQSASNEMKMMCYVYTYKAASLLMSDRWNVLYIWIDVGWYEILTVW